MFFINKQVQRILAILIATMLVMSCVTETTESPTVKFDDAAVISVSNPGASISKRSTFAWLPEAVRFYEDERLVDTPIKKLIEAEIRNNIENKELLFVDSVNGSRYAIAYTAALESSLADATIIRRFGLLPGMASVPKGDENIEKGNLIIYAFDNRSGEIIWRSAAQVGVKFDMTEDQRKQRVTRVVAEMFQTLPVQKNQ